MISSSWIATVGTIVAAFLGGNLFKAIFDFIRDIRRGNAEQEDYAFKTLREMNADLRAEVKDLKTELDGTRKALDDERRARMRLEDRVAELERNAP